MYLSDLEIIGFKSFANKTQLKFSDGITAIVGPNGCGKTNIVDAIRWVLGEQKTTVLRSEIMEDVIFNGTSQRKPLSMAEVTLTLQNNKGILPIEYSEVTVTRRLFRDGTSNYLLNKTQCRLKDIVDLFLDTGLAPDSYSVIELKMVEAILSGKPEERRNLLEEAAGVKKYKLRRKEATKKLQAIQSDLVRVNDVISEIQTLVNSLSRQASKTKRYNKLSEQLKELETKFLGHQYLNYNSMITEIENKLKTTNEAKIEKEQFLEDLEINSNEIKSKLNLEENQYRNYIEEEINLQNEISQTSQNLAVGKERLSALNSSQQRIQNELKEFDDNYNLNLKRIEEVKETIQKIKSKKNEKFSDVENQKLKVNEFKQLVETARQDVAEITEDVLKYQNAISSLYNDVNRNKNRIESLNRSINESKEEIRNLENKLQNTQKELEIESKKIKDFDDRIEKIEEKYNISQEEKTTLNNEIELINEQISEEQIKLNQAKSSLDFLKSLKDTDETVKLLQSNEWQTQSPKQVLAEIIATDDKYRVAVASLLGIYAKSFIVSTNEDIEKAKELLVKHNKGKASFIIRDNIKFENLALSNQTVNNFINLYNIIRCDDKLKYLLFTLFGDVIIVEDDNEAKKIAENNSDLTVITLTGNIYKSNYYVRAGSTITSDATFIGKNERIEQLSNLVNKLEKNIKILKTNKENLKERYDEIDLIELQNKLKNAQQEKNIQLQIISKKEYEIEGLEQNLNILNKNNENFINEIQRLEKELEQAKLEIKEYEEKLELYQEQQLTKSSELNNLIDELKELENNFNEAQLEYYRFEQELESNLRELQSVETQNENLLKTKDQRIKELENNKLQIEKLEINLKEYDNKLNDLNKELEKLKEQKKESQIRLNEIKEELEQQENEIRFNRKELDKIIAELHQIDLTYNDLKSKIESIEIKALESYSIDLKTEKIDIDNKFSIDEVKNEVNSIKEKLSSLGNVNFMALEEYETQNERLQFYTKQVNDLTESETNLIETIEEINHTAKTKFKDTFKIVNENFQKLFKILFGEDGESELQLMEGDPLESNIEIIAKPPNKKPRNIEALSGGEKTLAAIALLFAIYLVKPSPFCILDEVDAPLDDANIDRFINLIKDFKEQTQFIIVTHNKETMEAANNLYGITMEEQGVSKIVSVRFSTENN